MTAYEFVKNLWENSDASTVRMDIETARADLENFRSEDWDVPENLTAEEYMETWNGLVTEYESDMMDNMVQEYLIDHADENEDDPLILDGKPYIDEDSGKWTQEAHDSGHDYALVAEKDGNIYIEGVSSRR